MGFYEVVRQTAMLLQRQGKLTYRTLKRQFALDDDALADLKDELLFSHPVVDEDGRGLVWTGGPATPEADARGGAEQRFQERVLAVIGLLQSQKRVTYRTLKFCFDIDEARLAEICDELRLRRLAIDEEGKVLVWTSLTSSSTQPATSVANPSDVAQNFSVFQIQ
jgi:hypothetical protein